MATLVEALARELERPRPLSPRVLNYITGTYEIDYDGVGAFLVHELPKLEDYELDLILSPVFTPKLTDQAAFSELLGRDSVPQNEWPALVEQLVNRPVHAQLVTPDTQSHSVLLRHVTIERYVHRLRLEGTISTPVLALIDHNANAADRAMLKAVARRAAWENEGRAGILLRFLTVTGASSDTLADTVELLNLVEDHKPANLDDLITWIPKRQETLREQLASAGRKPFFNQNIEELHGGGRDQRQEDDPRVAAKQAEFAFLARLRQVLSG